jgi:hypothetical protein
MGPGKANGMRMRDCKRLEGARRGKKRLGKEEDELKEARKRGKGKRGSGRRKM